MQIIITDSKFNTPKVLQLSWGRVSGLAALAFVVLMVVCMGLYHWVFMKGAREGWPVISTLVRTVFKDESAQRERFMRENLDVMAKRVGEMQARMVQVESLLERVAPLAGLNAQEFKAKPGQGGVLFEGRSLTNEALDAALSRLAGSVDGRIDVLTVVESRLFDQRLKNMMLPTAQPVPGSNLGSPFGWRVDPFTGRSALHSGLDYQAPPGTPILAAAGGVVTVQEYHAGYGNMVDIDHGNGLVTRYAHALETFVTKGQIVKPGQKIASVGSTGRSTGPHLHFEVLVEGVPQDPHRFFAMAPKVDATVAKAASQPALARKR
jgi:murein DD-endopeptidase MepM/ murein hydrolase activator NlpD